MKQRITISLDDFVLKALNKATRKEKISKSEFINRILSRDLIKSYSSTEDKLDKILQILSHYQ